MNSTRLSPSIERMRAFLMAEERLQLYRELHLARARIAELEDQQYRSEDVERR